jgi:hypothetical protein
MSIIKWGYLSDVLLSRIGLSLFGQGANEVFQRFLSARGITTGDDFFESLFVI